MELFADLMLLILTATVIENTIFMRAFGISSMILHGKDKNEVLPFGILITFFSVIAALFSYFSRIYIFTTPESLMYLPTLSVVAIGFVYLITLLFLWKFFYRTFKKVRKFIHVSALNSTVVGVVFCVYSQTLSLPMYLVYAFGTGLGFFLAHFILSVSYDKLNSPKVPESFRGFPAMILYIGIISMAFLALS